jgi:hypothetical protein
MDNQHKHIKGYRDLSAEEIALMNQIKTKGEELGALVKSLEHAQKAETDTLQAHTGSEDFADRVDALLEARRWTAIGKTQLQQGIMAVIRAVARPITF